VIQVLSLEFSAADVERALFTKELGVTEDGNPTASVSDSISPPPTKDQKKRSAAVHDDVEKGRVDKRQKAKK
jgi:hypothetical protein